MAHLAPSWPEQVLCKENKRRALLEQQARWMSQRAEALAAASRPRQEERSDGRLAAVEAELAAVEAELAAVEARPSAPARAAPEDAPEDAPEEGAPEEDAMEEELRQIGSFLEAVSEREGLSDRPCRTPTADATRG